MEWDPDPEHVDLSDEFDPNDDEEYGDYLAPTRQEIAREEQRERYHYDQRDAPPPVRPPDEGGPG